MDKFRKITSISTIILFCGSLFYIFWTAFAIQSFYPGYSIAYGLIFLCVSLLVFIFLIVPLLIIDKSKEQMYLWKIHILFDFKTISHMMILTTVTALVVIIPLSYADYQYENIKPLDLPKNGLIVIRGNPSVLEQQTSDPSLYLNKKPLDVQQYKFEDASHFSIALTIGPKDNIYLHSCCPIDKHLTVLSLDGEELFQVPLKSEIESGFSWYIDKITVDSNENIFVLDTRNSQVLKFSSDGKFLTKWGSDGTADDQFSFPTSLSIDNDDNVWVGNTHINKIQMFSNDGGFIKKIEIFPEDPHTCNVKNMSFDSKSNIIISFGGLTGWCYYGNFEKQFNPENIALFQKLTQNGDLFQEWDVYSTSGVNHSGLKDNLNLIFPKKHPEKQVHSL